MIWSRSRAERLSNRIEAAFEFDYGVQYAWMLTVFTITLSFSVVCPLIVPFGLFYFIMKHIIDRYNIYFCYVSTKVDKQIHTSAVTFCIFSLLMLQVCILFFIAIRTANIKLSAMAIVQITVVVITFFIFFGRLFFGIFKRLTPFKRKEKNIVSKDLESNSSNDDDDDDYDNEDNIEIEKKFAEIVKVVELEEDENKNRITVETTQPLPGGLNDELKKGSHLYSLVNKEKKKSKKFKVIIESPFMPALLRQNTQDNDDSEFLNRLIKKSTVRGMKNESEDKPISINDINVIIAGALGSDSTSNQNYGSTSRSISSSKFYSPKLNDGLDAEGSNKFSSAKSNDGFEDE